MFAYAREPFLGIDEDTDTASVMDAKVARVGRTRVAVVFTSAATDISTLSPGRTYITWAFLEGGELIAAVEGHVVVTVNIRVLGGTP